MCISPSGPRIKETANWKNATGSRPKAVNEQCIWSASLINIQTRSCNLRFLVFADWEGSSICQSCQVSAWQCYCKLQTFSFHTTVNLLRPCIPRPSDSRAQAQGGIHMFSTRAFRCLNVWELAYALHVVILPLKGNENIYSRHNSIPKSVPSMLDMTSHHFWHTTEYSNTVIHYLPH